MSHSSSVTLELRAGHQRVKLAQIAQDSAITAEECELSAGVAEFLIDGYPTLMPVRIDQQRLAKGARFRLHNTCESAEHANS